MARGIRKKRLRLFDRGASSIERDFPGFLAGQARRELPPVYLCPICRRGFVREAALVGELTAEHVPPRSLGGPPLVLTCRRCNSVSGRGLDIHARRREWIHDIFSTNPTGRVVQRAKMRMGETEVDAVITSEGREISLDLTNNPAGVAESFKPALEALQPFTLSFSAPSVSDRMAGISWLRAGYLVLFSVFGYRVVLDSAFDAVRRQIQEPETESLARFSATLPAPRPWSERRFVRVKSPYECRAVIFGRHALLFPLFGEVDFYGRLQADSAPGPQLSGDSFEWPIEPPFGARGNAA